MSLELKQMIHPVRKGMLVGSLGLALLALLMFGCGSGSATTATEVRHPQMTPDSQARSRGHGSVHKVPWAGRPGRNRRFMLFAYVGYCSHGPKPYPQRVIVRRKARRVTLTLLVHFPRRAHPCLGEEIQLRTAVKIQAPLKRLSFFDGSQTPSVQRWPHP